MLLNEAGFKAAKNPGSETDFAVVVGNAGGIWASDGAKSKLPQLIEWLTAQEWCGPLFTRNGEGGTLLSSEICTDHARAPDICLIMRSNDAANNWGVSGTTLHDAPYPIGGGCHGGLSAHELQNVLVLGGATIAAGEVVQVPAGNIDVMPTVLHLLGLPEPDGLDGRVLREAFSGGGGQAGEAVEKVISAPNGQTHLSVTEYGRQRYLNKAWVE